MVTLQQVGQRIYFADAPYAAKDAIKGTGAKWDPDRRQWWIGVAKLAKAESLVAKINEPAQPGAQEERPSAGKIELSGKAEYKGRTYYVGRHGSRDGSKLHLFSLPDSKGEYIDFWADANACRLVKTYAPRERWNGRRGGGTVMVYTTLGGIADFIAEAKRAERGEVPAGWCHDLEDGLVKPRGQCDMPEDRSGGP